MVYAQQQLYFTNRDVNMLSVCYYTLPAYSTFNFVFAFLKAYP